MTTTDLDITSFTKDPTGTMSCSVTVVAPLYINRLILHPSAGLGSPFGMVNPGTPPAGSLRTIYLNSANSVFGLPPGAFKFAVTYDANYHVTDAQVVTTLGAVG